MHRPFCHSYSAVDPTNRRAAQDSNGTCNADSSEPQPAAAAARLTDMASVGAALCLSDLWKDVANVTMDPISLDDGCIAHSANSYVNHDYGPGGLTLRHP